jgi:hypothetical protein
MFRTALVAAAATALTVVSTGLSAQTLGIAACDDFLKKYETCVTSQVPAIENACKQSAEQMKTAMSGFGCKF